MALILRARDTALRPASTNGCQPWLKTRQWQVISSFVCASSVRLLKYLGFSRTGCKFPGGGKSCQIDSVVKLNRSKLSDGMFRQLAAARMDQGSQNFKIPGSPSGRYSSDFGSPKINVTNPKKKKRLVFFKESKCQSKIFSIHKYQQIWRNFISPFTRYLQNFKNKFKAIYDPF